MAEDDKNKNDTFRWAVGALIGLLAAGGGIAALVGLFLHNKDDNRNQAQPTPTVTVKPTAALTTTPLAVKCKVAGKVYDLDKNNSPMADVKVYLIDNKHPDVLIQRTAPDGTFAWDCSEIPSDNFPKKVKVLTSSNASLIEDEIPISQQGNENLNVYISEKNLQLSKILSGAIEKQLRVIRPGPILANKSFVNKQ